MPAIFLIDDEPIELDLIANTLRAEGYEVRAMTDAMAAYNAIAEAPASIDLLITHTEMKRMTGFQLFKALRQLRILCPVIFISRQHRMAGVISDSLGQRAVIETPFDAPQLRAAVAKALAAAKARPPVPARATHARDVPASMRIGAAREERKFQPKLLQH